MTWNNNFSGFAAVLASVQDEPWWIADPDLKYLNIRLDTRDNAFLLFPDTHRPEKMEEQIEPERVLAAIQRYKELHKGD